MFGAQYAIEEGYLELILGPMFSGKTTRILEIYNHYSYIQKRIIVINYAEDKRYHETMLSTHDHKMIPCVLEIDLKDMWTNSNNKNYSQIHKSDVILINEGQFFPDLEDFVRLLLNHGKKIYICGLDGDFERKKFGSILDLIPICDKVSKLSSLCSHCKDGTPGIFSMRLTDEKKQTVVGSDNYIPVCRKCYDNKNN
jgi:thymidine kinase